MAIQMFPGESDKAALSRRIKMHEFLIPGGIQTGYGADGKMTYSDPIVVSETTDCPWHGKRCEAWAAIRNGEGSASELRAVEWRLSQLEQEHLYDLTNDKFDVKLMPEIEELRAQRDKLQKIVNPKATIRDLRAPGRQLDDLEPFWALFRADKSVDEGTILCNGHQRHDQFRRRAITQSNSDTEIAVWRRVPRKDRECFACAAGEPVTIPSFGSHKQVGFPWARESQTSMVFEPEEDARDTAIDAFAAEEIPDEIVFEPGEEEDE